MKYIKFQNDSYKDKVSIAKNFIKKNLNIEIENLIIKNNWEEDAILCVNILNNTISVENQNYLNEKLNLSHLRDRRTPVEYACDLILGWVIEDGIVDILNSLKIKSELNSADRNRKFLKKPKSSSDLKIKNHQGKTILIELVKDYTSYWSRNGSIELRDNKYNNLKNENSILLGIDFKNNEFFIMKIDEIEATFIPFHYPFRKPAYSIEIKKDDFHDLNHAKQIFSKFFNNLY